MTKQQIHIIGGGTVSHVRPHLALACPTYGTTAYDIRDIIHDIRTEIEADIHMYITKMGGRSYERTVVSGGRYFHPTGEEALLQDILNDPILETNEDVARLIDRLVEDPDPKIIFMPVGMVDFEVEGIGIGHDTVLEPGKHLSRLSTHDQNNITLRLKPTEKIIRRIKKNRKDIFLVGFKTTAGLDMPELFTAGLSLLREADCDLVLASDIHSNINMVVTPEEVPYAPTIEREQTLISLVAMTLQRSKTTRVMSWNSKEDLQEVVDRVNVLVKKRDGQ